MKDNNRHRYAFMTKNNFKMQFFTTNNYDKTKIKDKHRYAQPF